jgi:hypothetical protein
LSPTGYREALPKTKSHERSYAFIFISHAVLEPESLLLAASLKTFLRCEHELIAAVPTHDDLWGAPSELANGLFEELGVRTAPITNTIDPAYPTINRIFCLQIPTDADKVVVIDSDMLCMRPFEDEPRFGIPFNSKPASLRTFTTEIGPWRAAYAETKVPMPDMRMPTTVSRQYIPPYFNTGLVAVDRECDLGPAWLECCAQIMGNPSVPEVGRWADQIALAVAVEKLGLPYDCLDDRYNFPLRLRPLEEESLPYFCHYGNFRSATREPVVVEAVRSLVAERPALAEALQGRDEWAPVFEEQTAGSRRRPTTLVPQERSRPELVVTGIVGSGIDLLTDMLNGYSNCVTLYEPEEILRRRANQPAPWMIAPFYRQARADLLDGTHELEIGEGIEGDDFVLGTAYAHAYLLRLNAIRRAMPGARIVACVRDPFETIALWKEGFEGLPEADEVLGPTGDDADASDSLSWLTLSQRETLSLIAATSDPAQRRATWWQLLAESILDQGEGVTIVDHRRLLEEPGQVLAEALSGYPAGTPRPFTARAEPANAEVALDEHDRQAIRAICAQAAADLGL